MSKKIDLTDQVFGRLYVLEESGRNKWNFILWKCQCRCGNIKSIVGRDLRNGATKSCGCLLSECSLKRRKGKKHPEEVKQKIAIGNKGKFVSAETRWKQSEIAKNRSEEHKKKISEARKGKYCGEDNPNWNPNLTDEDRIDRRHIPWYTEWRSAVFDRDNYTCQVCNDDGGGNLNAHHLESYRSNPELRTTVENGITLCETCHKDFHHQYGYGNNTIEQFKEFVSTRS